MHYTRDRSNYHSKELKEKVERDMEFAQRGVNQQPNAAGVSSAAPAPHGRGKDKGVMMWSKLAILVLSISGGILLIAMLIFIVFGKTASEGKFVKTGEDQAVFLNGGQVYFGQIKDLNNQFLRLQNIYYLRVNQTVQPNQTTAANTASSNDVSLVKLGCELHGPQDEMLVNRSQIIFWENLKSDGQVAKAVSDYKKQNPNGQKCDTTTGTSTPTNTTTKP
jgi:hypothetical protein